MDQSTYERLFGCQEALANPATKWITPTLAALLTATPLVFIVLQGLGRIGPNTRRELWLRYWSWLVLVPLMLVPLMAKKFGAKK